ncbi:MAG TPA: chemotaxis protein CheW [Nitrospirota bacterium]|nr:chemotaxis protein CheW [Nitrospirota bacterium]
MAEETTAGAAPAAEGLGMQLAVFVVGGQEYAVDIMQIMEIIRPQKVTRIPKSPAFVEGVINLRGKVVPVMDMRGRFGVEGRGEDLKRAKVIIMAVGDRLVGAVVDEVSEVIHLPVSEVEDTPDTVKGMDSEFIKGVGKAGERLILVLDVEKLLTRQEMLQLAQVEDQAADEAAAGGGPC